MQPFAGIVGENQLSAALRGLMVSTNNNCCVSGKVAHCLAVFGPRAFKAGPWKPRPALRAFKAGP